MTMPTMIQKKKQQQQLQLQLHPRPHRGDDDDEEHPPHCVQVWCGAGGSSQCSGDTESSSSSHQGSVGSVSCGGGGGGGGADGASQSSSSDFFFDIEDQSTSWPDAAPAASSYSSSASSAIQTQQQQQQQHRPKATTTKLERSKTEPATAAATTTTIWGGDSPPPPPSGAPSYSPPLSPLVRRETLQQLHRHRPREAIGSTAPPTTKEKTQTKTQVQETRVQHRLRAYVRFCDHSANQDILIKVLQWTLFAVGTPCCQQLAYQVSYARYVTRLLGLPAAVDAALHDSWSATSDLAPYRTAYRCLGKVLALSMILYYPMEHAALFCWIHPLAADANEEEGEGAGASAKWWRDGNTWSYLSCRCWCLYTAIDLIQCLIQLHELRHKRAQLVRRTTMAKKTDLYHDRKSNSKNNNSAVNCCGGGGAAAAASAAAVSERVTSHSSSSTSPVPSLQSLRAAALDRTLQLTRNVAMLYPAMHWSMSNQAASSAVHPFLSSPSHVYALMWIEAVVHLHQYSLY
jgi:hypothetical protein